MSDATRKWTETVLAEHAQSDRVRSGNPQADHWRGLAHRFAPASRDDAYRDGTLKALLRVVRSDDTVLDVGAGAGRLAVPLAEQCRHVTAVEPSEAMVERLTEQAQAWGVRNLAVVPERWEDVTVEAADVVICAHVVYTVIDIERFLEKLAAHARREVALVVFEEPAMSNYFPLWRMVHGEERISLPSLAQLKGVLAEIGAQIELEQLPEWESRPFKDEQSAVEESLTRLFVAPDTERAARTASAVRESLVPEDGGFRFKWAKPHRPYLVRWRTAG